MFHISLDGCLQLAKGMLQKANLNLAITGCLPIKQAIMTVTVFDNSLKFQNFESTPGDWNLCKKKLLTLQDLF